MCSVNKEMEESDVTCSVNKQMRHGTWTVENFFVINFFIEQKCNIFTKV